MRSLHLSLLLLPTATTAQTLIRVCGSSYSDATVNCTINPSCPTGDGCPSDKDTCFALPEESCQAPPSASPIITPLQVCGMDYEDAKSHCDNLCELGCGALEACFAVSPDECVVEMDTESDLLTEDEGGDPVLIMEEATDVAVCGLSFADAAANCETGTPCSSSGAGMECATGQACFVVPLVNCTAAVTGSTVTMTMVNTTAPNVEETPAPAPTEPPVKPTHIFVCGVDYGDAELNCNGNTECPSGDGCSGGDTCFAIPYDNCRPAAVTTVAAGTTVALEGSTVSAVGTTPAPGTTEAAGNATVAFEGTTQAATTAASGEPNLFFCGESYEVAETNCFTNVPCPAGGGCPEGQACFGIPNECKSPEPTLSPSAGATETITNLTVSTENADNVTETVNDTTPALLRTVEPSLSPVTSSPTEAPIVNTHFCGANCELCSFCI